ncbi:uncharacterized protein LAESUDRAFT_735610 [Laetiporus sulphureus 93-53]|uniref:Uncharacterized protein n=1 Tax=Laetiporus sulphureus 93-53 TaxID=1314785 RepID=A0A165FF55_9APHY|nr:uncharacterized protein LAESUDRAFT_735610 [Laetiporus sulphureus 93-53]KZT08876.1 hypothetical protein LAESUDRAFT_735610 [Laetiporus sulphureus 93-53]
MQMEKLKEIKDYVNPHTRPHIELYSICSTRVSEPYHSKKWVYETVPELQAPIDGPLIEVHTGELKSNYYDLSAMSVVCDLSGPLPQGIYIGLNPLREIAKGRCMYTSFIKPWGDDVSGNRSKQYNDHTNVYLVYANLPHMKLSQEYFVHFLSMSQHACAGEQFDNIWHEAYDYEIKEEVLSEICSHVGLKGTELEQESDQKYHEHFSPGPLRKVEHTKKEVLQQLHLVALGMASAVATRQTASGVKDKVAEHWIQTLITSARDQQQIQIHNAATRDRCISNHYSSLLELDICLSCSTTTVDVHQDMPQCDLFAVCLQASSVDGLNILPLRATYMVQYRNNLIGKHFKALQQLRFFYLHENLCPPLILDIWRVTRELGALLWYHEIEDMDAYLTLIDNVLDIWASIDSRRIFVKPKLHILAHLVEDVHRHGPPILYSTEIFECYNAIFRMCSILSNHQALSRDIVWACAEMDRFKHIISSGWWKDPSQHRFMQAGECVREYFSDKHIQCWLGFMQEYIGQPESLRSSFASHSTWICGLSVVAQNNDNCHIGSWAFAAHNHDDTVLMGHIIEILQATMPGLDACNCIIMEAFIVLNSRHPYYNMSELKLDSLIVIDPMSICCVVNVQHNCYDAKCGATGHHQQMQERTVMDIHDTIWQHRDTDSYIINLHALHNAALIRRYLL